MTLFVKRQKRLLRQLVDWKLYTHELQNYKYKKTKMLVCSKLLLPQKNMHCEVAF